MTLGVGCLWNQLLESNPLPMLKFLGEMMGLVTVSYWLKGKPPFAQKFPCLNVTCELRTYGTGNIESCFFISKYN